MEDNIISEPKDCVVLKRDEYLKLLNQHPANEIKIINRLSSRGVSIPSNIDIFISFTNLEFKGVLWKKIRNVVNIVENHVNSIIKNHNNLEIEKNKDMIENLLNKLKSMEIEVISLSDEISEIKKMNYWQFRKYKKSHKNIF